MKFLALILLSLSLFSCNKSKGASTDARQAKATERLVSEANRRIGLPEITNFTEKRFVKMLYELRDKQTTTYTYTVNRDGHKIFFCKSIGFGIPAAVQFVSPKKQVRGTSGGYNMTVLAPQPEPNGLFMPDSLSATYVMCLHPKTNKIAPVYVEPLIVVSPFKFAK